MISCLRLWGTLRVWLSPDEKLGFPATCPPSSETAVAEIDEFGVGSSLLPGLVNVYKKRTGKIHHAIHGKINYFDWAMASSSQTVNVITRGYPIWSKTQPTFLRVIHVDPILSQWGEDSKVPTLGAAYRGAARTVPTTWCSARSLLICGLGCRRDVSFWGHWNYGSIKILQMTY